MRQLDIDQLFVVTTWSLSLSPIVQERRGNFQNAPARSKKKVQK